MQTEPPTSGPAGTTPGDRAGVLGALVFAAVSLLLVATAPLAPEGHASPRPPVAGAAPDGTAR